MYDLTLMYVHMHIMCMYHCLLYWYRIFQNISCTFDHQILLQFFRCDLYSECTKKQGAWSFLPRVRCMLMHVMRASSSVMLLVPNIIHNVAIALFRLWFSIVDRRIHSSFHAQTKYSADVHKLERECDWQWWVLLCGCDLYSSATYIGKYGTYIRMHLWKNPWTQRYTHMEKAQSIFVHISYNSSDTGSLGEK